jgi:phage gpG-like protein
MSLKVQLVITGPDEPSGEALELLAVRARDARPAMKAILDVMLEGEQKTFDTGGAAGGRSWMPDSAAWAARKRRAGKSGQPERYTDALMKSLTLPRAKGAVRRVNKFSAVLGTTLYYAKWQKKRQPLATLRYVPGVVAKAQDVIVEWFMEGTVTS